jgi:purine-binding chemotaxis protein CheW
LANSSPGESPVGTAFPIVILEIGNGRFALPSLDVREIQRAVAIVPLPKAPPIVEGLINVHGRLVPVLDVRARFGIPPRLPSIADHFVLARAKERLVALRVDRALDVVRIDTADIDSADATGYGVPYVAGIAKLPGGLVLIHDLGTFLDAAEAATLDEAVSSVSPAGTT